MKKWMKVTLISVVSLVLVAGIVFGVYVSDYGHADEVAVAAMANDQTIKKDGNLTILSPTNPGDTAVIFYPGGKVEYSAYIPLLEKLRQNGITSVLVKMPFNLAVFNSGAADEVYKKLPDIKNWYIGGHSLGGAMASSYASKHQDKVKGLILLGAYVYGGISPDNALTIYGSNDYVMDQAKVDYTTNVHKINGGNHAQFGNYGLQKGDGTATITREQQQDETAGLILDFIKSKNAQ
ncbi:MAG: alpha/beta fold hydrolase [Paenibacillaceae bacterium]|jgi:flagellar basal body-associated protein FliL|nr:alpha/beta fold hydrolase [Paenibacillaceae bacterium]